MLLTVLWLVAVVAALLLYCRQIYTRFSRYGVKNLTPLPILGNTGFMVARKEHFAYNLERVYKQFKEERFVGTYMFTLPLLNIHDLELIKKIAVKDFEYFVDHRTFVSEEVDPFFGRNLFSLKGQEWKDMRSTLSPAFTSSKIRVMVPFMVEVGDQMIRAIKRKIKESGENCVDLEVKDLTSRYANDVIASCAFGLKVDSHTEEDNEFYKMGALASNFKFSQFLKFFGYTAFPETMKMLRISLFTETTKRFFKDLVLNTMDDREKRNIIRADMIHLLMEAKKGKLSHDDTHSNEKDEDAGFATVEESAVGKKDINREWADEDLIAQAVLFFIAGFETVSSAMTFLVHELALNPDVQNKLIKEIRETDAKYGGKFDYNSIQSMTYLDMVVSETLRLWPAAVALDRRCNKDYNCGPPNDQADEDYIIRKGEGVQIPVWAIHRDPDYFPNPEKFDPERFSNENKHNIKPFTYMPFGLGPRNCIGSRFALCEVKVIAYQILKQFEVSPCEKTCIPTVLSTESFNLRMVGGHWLRFQVRK